MTTVLFNKMKMLEHLQDTVSVLQQHGWTRGVLTNQATGAHCLVGAHRAAIDYADWDDIRSDYDFAVALGFFSINGVYSWNDYIAADEDEVINRVMESIEKLIQTA